MSSGYKTPRREEEIRSQIDIPQQQITETNKQLQKYKNENIELLGIINEYEKLLLEKTNLDAMQGIVEARKKLEILRKNLQS